MGIDVSAKKSKVKYDSRLLASKPDLKINIIIVLLFPLLHPWYPSNQPRPFPASSMRGFHQKSDNTILCS